VIVLFGCVGWAAIVLAFGLVIGNPADPRVLYHFVVSLALAAFALRGAVATNRQR
jgi:exosortase/archaeosortase